MSRSIALLVVVAAVACSSEAPTAVGFAVEADSACHTLLLAQCQCCEAPLTCAGNIDFQIAQGKLWTNVPDSECENRPTGDELCATLDTEAEVQDACNGYRLILPEGAEG